MSKRKSAINTFFYLLRQGIKNLWLNRMMTMASVLVLAACLLIVGLALLLTNNIQAMVGLVEDQNEMVAFMYKPYEKEIKPQLEALMEDHTSQDSTSQAQEAASESVLEDTAEQTDDDTPQDTDPAELDPLEEEYVQGDVLPQELKTAFHDLTVQTHQQILLIPHVEEVTYVSSEEGLRKQREELGDKGYLLENYQGDRNPIRASFVVKIDDIVHLQTTADAIEALPGIMTVSAATQVADTLVDVRDIVRYVCWAVILALLCVSLLIITNTIRATIHTRRQEITIMKYVGATRRFIRTPFIVEGIGVGVLATCLAYPAIWAVYTFGVQALVNQSSPWLSDLLEGLISFDQLRLPILIAYLCFSIGIGVLGSVFSLRKHSKV